VVSVVWVVVCEFALGVNLLVKVHTLVFLLLQIGTGASGP
jgi:hypothetical protein